MSIYERLRDAQLGLKAPRSEDGRFGKSRSAEMILEAAKPVLHKHDLTLTLTDKIIFIEGRHYVEATAKVWSDGGAFVEATASAWEGSVDRGLDSSQVTGKTSSYARKYALCGLLAIDDNKDADHKDFPAPVAAPANKPAVGSAPVQPEPSGELMATEIQKRQVKAFLQGIGVQDNEMTQYLEDNFGFVAGTKMTKADATMILRELRELRFGGENAGEAES